MPYRSPGLEEKEFNRQLGLQLAKMREARGITGAALARALGIVQQRIYWIEAGGSCSPFLLTRIAGALRVQVRSLLPITTSTCNLKKVSPRRPNSC